MCLRKIRCSCSPMVRAPFFRAFSHCLAHSCQGYCTSDPIHRFALEELKLAPNPGWLTTSNKCASTFVVSIPFPIEVQPATNDNPASGFSSGASSLEIYVAKTESTKYRKNQQRDTTETPPRHHRDTGTHPAQAGSHEPDGARPPLELIRVNNPKLSLMGKNVPASLA